MTDSIPLGFDVDTSSLLRGKMDAAALMQALQGLGNTLGTLGQQSVGAGMQVQGLAAQFSALGAGLGQGASGLTGGLNGVAGGLARVTSALGPAGMAIGGVVIAMTALAATGAAVLSTLAKQQEEFLKYEARLKNVYGSANIAADAFRNITKLAQDNGIAISATAEAYLRLARNNEAIGLTRDQMLELTDAVQKLGRVSGASQGELSGGLMQFSQALAAGRLNGDELRSIMENMPALAKAIADGLGVSVGQLRAMGAEGQLTSQKVVGALRSQIDEINKEFAGMPDTTEQAFTRVSNSWDRLLAGMGERLNASGILTGLGNATAAVIGAAADAVAPETAQDRADARYRAFLQAQQNYFSNNPTGLLSGIVGRYDSADMDKALRDLQYGEGGQALTEMIRAQASEARDAQRAPYVASASVAQEVDKNASQVKKLREEMQALDRAYKAYLANPEAFEPQEIERLKQYPEYMAAMRVQLEAIRYPLDDYIRKTEKMGENLAKYGAGGAASIADEAGGLVSASAKVGRPISYDQAEAAVFGRRTVELQSQTEAMKLQVEQQKMLADAMGRGAQASIEAEAATKTLNLQMQLFGKDLTPEATRQLDAYRRGLEELLRVQRDVTNAQREANAEQEIAIERALIAAQRNGANAGELREIERQLRLIQTMQNEGMAAPAGAPGTAFAGPMGFPVATGPGALGGGSIPASRVDGNTVLQGLQPAIEGIVAGVMKNYPVNGISGVRAGDKGSQHQHGNAFDLDISMLSMNDRRKLVSELLSGAYGRVGGIGTYNEEATSLHVDARPGRFAWGPNKSRTSLNQTPDWFESMTTAWMNGANPGGSGVTAALAEDQLGLLRTTREEERKLLELTEQRARLMEQINGKSAVAIKAAEQEAEARRYASEFSPERQQVAYQEKLAELKLQDEARTAAMLRSLDEETALAEEKLRIARLTGREREIEMRVLETVNQQKRAGIELDKEQVDAIRANVTRQVNLEFDVKEAQQDADKFKEVWNDAAQSIGSALNNAIRQAVMTGKIDAESILKGLIADITTSIFNAFITQPLVSGISSFFASHGGAFDGGIKMAFAGGGVVNSPTIFPMARGAGLMGEAGPEAILPLKRGPDGKLGVGAGSGGGGGISVVVNDMRQNGGAQPVEVEESEGPDGSRQIQILVRDEVRRQIKSGEVDREMRQSYGLSRQLTRR